MTGVEVTPEVYIALGVFVLGLAFGLRGCVRLTRRYLGVRPLLDPRDASLLLGMVVVAWIVFLSASYAGVRALARVAGIETPEWTALIGAFLAAGVLFVPTILDAVVQRVARDIDA